MNFDLLEKIRASVTLYTKKRTSNVLEGGFRSIFRGRSLDFDELKERPNGESSAVIKARVDAAREIQKRRFAGGGTRCNAYMEPKELAEYCALDAEGETLMRGAFEALGLTARSYDRILRVARTIADLDGSETLRPEHIAEAVQYRVGL